MPTTGQGLLQAKIRGWVQCPGGGSQPKGGAVCHRQAGSLAGHLVPTPLPSLPRPGTATRGAETHSSALPPSWEQLCPWCRWTRRPRSHRPVRTRGDGPASRNGGDGERPCDPGGASEAIAWLLGACVGVLCGEGVAPTCPSHQPRSRLRRGHTSRTRRLIGGRVSFRGARTKMFYVNVKGAPSAETPLAFGRYASHVLASW